MARSRVRSRRVLLPALFLAVLPAAASGTTGFERVEALTLGLESGNDLLISAVSDGTHAYFGTYTSPGRVVKVNLATMTQEGDALELAEGEDYLWSAVSDGTHAYFVTNTSPGRVVKVNLATMTRVGALTLNPGEVVERAAVSDGSHAYFGTLTAPGKVVKVRLDGAICAEGVVCGGMERVGALELGSGEIFLQSAVSDGTHAYFGTLTAPGKVVKVNLATMTRVGALQLGTGENFLESAVSDGTHAYFGTQTSPGRVVKVRLDGAICALGVVCGGMEQVGEALILDSGENNLVSAVSDGTHAYFGTYTSPGRVVKVNLATMTQEGDALELADGEDYLWSAVSDGTHAYFGTETAPGKVVKVRLGLADVGAPGVAMPPSVSCVPLPPAVGATITCRITGGDPGIDILWRAAYNPAFGGAGVSLDDAGVGEFSFVVPVAALGEELTVTLVEWTAPVSLGVVGGPVPAAVPAGDGPVPLWPILMAALVAFGLLGRGVRAQA